ncbi:MAG: hypothetical protein KDE59_12900 [Anaerolineales bacterium]|nr:hypothetical protein [Anaerolineales bacterium]
MVSQRISSFWINWLLVATAGVTLFGLAFVLLPDVMQRLFNWLLFGQTASPFAADVNAYLTFVYGVLGAVMVGWSLCLFYLIHNPLRRGERGGWLALALSLAVWYAIDTPFSLATGNPGNAALNTLFLLIFAIPIVANVRLLWTAKPR